ncbi:hypothetical protein GINT2_000756 [Glugoides intestinalis]
MDKLLDCLENFNTIAILFSTQFKNIVKEIHDELTAKFPLKEILLVPSKDILCSAKCDKYESYVLVGIECILHRFDNAVQYRKPLEIDIERKVADFPGEVFIDSLYNIESKKSLNESIESSPILVVTENQMVLDYYCYKYEEVSSAFNSIDIKSKVKQIMKENVNGERLKEKKMVGVVFTSRLFEELATSIVRKINEFSRAYKIFLKDISYERLISIDNLDCIVLVDCPMFQQNISLHIPVLSPFSVECAINREWKHQYDRNGFQENKEKAIVLQTYSAEIMENRWFKGAIFNNEEEDMTIYEGRKGIATEYANEGERN